MKDVPMLKLLARATETVVCCVVCREEYAPFRELEALDLNVVLDMHYAGEHE
jgi:hypothetical protein